MLEPLQTSSRLAALLVCCGACHCFADWPQFRGPDGQGHAHASATIPVQFDESQNLVWKTEIPGGGWSSPVSVGDQIWLTSATNEGRSLRAICVDRKSGRIARNVEVFRRDDVEHVHPQNGHATPTPVIDEGRVFVHFGRNGTACLSNHGEVIWRNQDLKYTTPHGSANSPVIHGDLLIVCCDGSDEQFIAALNKHSGKIVWKRPRNHLEDARRKSQDEKDAGRKGLPFIAFSTPLVINVGGIDLVVSTPADHVVANRVNTGEEVWWMPYNCFSLVARPIYGNGLVYCIGGVRDGHYVLYAIDPTGRGKLTENNIVWSRTESVPQVPSPLLIGEKLLLLKDNGIATCLNAKSGDEHWQQRLGGNFRASPIAVGNQVYALSQEGVCHVFELETEFEPVAKNRLEGIFLASPAVVGNSLILRSDAHLYRFESSVQNVPK